MCENPDMKQNKNFNQFHEKDASHEEGECCHVLQSCTITPFKAKRKKTDPPKIFSQGGRCPYGVALRELNLKTQHQKRIRIFTTG